MKDAEKLLAAKIPGSETGIEIKKSICAICDPLTQCGIDAFVKDGKLLKVEGSENHPYNQGALCAKGASLRQYVYHSDRIKTPLKRTGERGSGEFEPISWEEALDLIAEKCISSKESFGPESVVIYSGYTKFFRTFLQRLALSFGTPNYCTESSACYTATSIAQRLVFGCDVAPDVKNTECLIVWSANPFHSSLGNGKAILRGLKRGMKLIVVDPRQTPTTAKADIHLPIIPGTDGALALAIANVIISENLYNKDFVENWTVGFDEYKNYAKEFSPERGEELTGVPKEKIIEAARMIARAKSAAVMPSAAPVVQNTNGVQNYRAVFQLIALTGNLDKAGGQIQQKGSFVHVPGNFKTREDEYNLSGETKGFAPGIGADKFPVWAELEPGQAQAVYLPEQLRTGIPYPLKVLVGFGMNYRMWPDSEGLKNSFSNLDFFVNIDLFMTDTCKQADLVLPACTSLERSEFRPYPMSYAIFTEPVIDPVYESRSDIDIIFSLANRICPDDKLLALGHERSIDWILEPSGMTVAMLKEYAEAMPVPNPIPFSPEQYKNGLATPSGKVEFVSGVLSNHSDIDGIDGLPVYRPSKNSPAGSPELYEEYPLILNAGSRLPMFIHSRTYRLSWTSALNPGDHGVDINPADAININDREKVKVTTPKGSIEVRANLTQSVMPGVVHIYHGRAESDVNTLFEWDYCDPISGFPGYRSSLCRIEKIGG